MRFDCRDCIDEKPNRRLSKIWEIDYHYQYGDVGYEFALLCFVCLIKWCIGHTDVLVR